ncbi:MAG: 4'-phosphopantetheinyl transferase superfamily protein [Kamptonema sp. SIO4C4]|nr:4'-phosphopantetheinyl transferase superfamily protein [Kamptonema sp. SIO4C4]
MTMKECQSFQPLNHSLQVLEIQSFKHLLEREGESFVQQHYTKLERSVSDTGERWIQYLAGRWVAKSVITNLLGKDNNQSRFWLDIEILRLPTGQPFVKLFGQSQLLATRLGIKQWLLSISHTAIYAVASVVVVIGMS